MTHQYSFHLNRRKQFKNLSVATTAHLTQHFTASVALGCANDCKHVLKCAIVIVLSCPTDVFFISLWTETSFLWVSATSLQASPRMPAPSPPPFRRPPLVSMAPLKKKRTKRVMSSEKAVFSLLFHTWLTSQLTWSRTSFVSLKVFRASGKCLNAYSKMS